MAIFIYNKNLELFGGENNYYIGRGSILGNPYTHIKDRETKATFVVNSRDDAINQYKHYFDVMYCSNIEYRKTIDEIYDKYRRGEDIFLGCYCKKYPCQDGIIHNDEVLCHGDIIKQKLQSRLMREKIKNNNDKTN